MHLYRLLLLITDKGLGRKILNICVGAALIDGGGLLNCLGAVPFFPKYFVSIFQFFSSIFAALIVTSQVDGC